MKNSFIKKIHRHLRHAFSTEKTNERPFTPDEGVLIDEMSSKIKKFGLETPAIIFLESIKPLNYIGSQALLFLRPIVSMISKCTTYDRFCEILENRNSIEELLKKIEKDK